MERFSEGLEIISDSLASIFKAKDYKLWLSKAKAELSLELLEECESSLSRASLYARTWIEELRTTMLFDKLNNKRALRSMDANQLSGKGGEVRMGKDQNVVEWLLSN